MDFKTKHEPNYLFCVKTEDGRIILDAIGNVTAGFPFLCKGSQKYVTPFYLKGVNDTIGATSKNTVVFNNGGEVPFVAPDVEPLLKNLRVPTVAVNISLSDYSRAIEFVPEVGEISKTIVGNKVTVFIPFVAFNDDAILLHRNVMKGDRIAIKTVLKRTEIKAVDRKILAGWAYRVDLINQSKKNLEGEEVSC